MLIIVCRTIVFSESIIPKMKDKLLLNFGKQIKSLRLKKGWSQEQLASLANVHRTYIGMIERGEKNVTLTNIYKIANALEISLRDLFKYEIDEQHENR